jgi:predicted phosphodiesterase
VGAQLIRIISDVHYADRSSRVRSLEQLRPLLEGISALVVNGDMLDTRPSNDPEGTKAAHGAVRDFAASAGVPVTFLTGNHDPDISDVHSLEFADGKILVTHGDVLFDSIVPWSKDAPMIRTRIIAALAALPEGESERFEGRIKAFRTVAASVPQLHQSEKDPLRYLMRFMSDTIWPPQRAFTILQSWGQTPERAASFAQRHRPKAGFVVVGHTHKPGVWKTRSGTVVINTGSFTRPFGAMGAEVSPGRLKVHRIVSRKGRFHRGADVAQYAL